MNEAMLRNLRDHELRDWSDDNPDLLREIRRRFDRAPDSYDQGYQTGLEDGREEMTEKERYEYASWSEFGYFSALEEYAEQVIAERIRENYARDIIDPLAIGIEAARK